MLVELDSILDTRLGVLLELDAEKVPAILAKDYHERLWDVFPEVDLLAYQDRYSKRDKKVLKNSWVTPMMDLAFDFVMKTLQQTLKTPFHKSPKLDVNIYPYVLTEEEESIILSAVVASTKDQCDIEIVSYSPEQLNPVFLKNNYEVVMMYDYQEWLEVHSKNGLWKKYSCPNVAVMAPLMYKNTEVYNPKTKVMDIIKDFETLSKTMAPYVDMQFIPLEAYCWKFNPHKTPTPTTEPDSERKGSGFVNP